MHYLSDLHGESGNAHLRRGAWLRFAKFKCMSVLRHSKRRFAGIGAQNAQFYSTVSSECVELRM